METPTPPFAKSYLTKFKIEDVLRPDDPMTVPLLRLMIATDDLRHLQKLLVIAREVDEAPTESDRLIHNGEIGHLFRLLCGHLYEAATPFRAVDQAARGRLDEAVGDDPEARRRWRLFGQCTIPTARTVSDTPSYISSATRSRSITRTRTSGPRLKSIFGKAISTPPWFSARALD